MISKKLLKIEASIASLSQEEQKLLLERLKNKSLSKFNIPQVQLEEQIQEMANDPEIQAEIAAINQEFSITEMDGLSK